MATTWYGRTIHKLTCRTCGEFFESIDDWRRYCSSVCFRKPGLPGTGDPNRHDPKEPVRYDSGELTRHSVSVLLRRWKRQGRACIYCGRPANTVDHVIPRARGGRNHIGNLAPCCRSCNSRKGSLFVIEWKAGRISAEQSAWNGRRYR